MNKTYKTKGIDSKSRGIGIVNKKETSRQGSLSTSEKARKLKYKQLVFQKLSKKEQTEVNIDNLCSFIQLLDGIFSNIDYKKVNEIINPSHIFLGFPKNIISDLHKIENYLLHKIEKYLLQKANYNLLNYNTNFNAYSSLFKKDIFESNKYQNFSKLKFKNLDEYFQVVEEEFLILMPSKKITHRTIDDCSNLDEYLDILFKKFEVLEKQKTVLDENVDDFINGRYFNF